MDLKNQKAVLSEDWWENVKCSKEGVAHKQ